MSVRTTIDIPDDLYESLRRRAASERTSIRSLVVGAVEQRFSSRRQRTPVLSPPVPGSGPTRTAPPGTPIRSRRGMRSSVSVSH